MNKNRMYQILLSPHISEKSAIAAEQENRHTFKVATGANKLEVRKAVEGLFSVKVESVQVLNVKGKERRFSSVIGQRSGWKKAVVRLADGHDIDYVGIEGK